jgi:hypothetical protein
MPIIFSESIVALSRSSQGCRCTKRSSMGEWFPLLECDKEQNARLGGGTTVAHTMAGFR